MIAPYSPTTARYVGHPRPRKKSNIGLVELCIGNPSKRIALVGKLQNLDGWAAKVRAAPDATRTIAVQRSRLTSWGSSI
jgi:hypothetical protein